MQQQDDIVPGKTASVALDAADEPHSEGNPVLASGEGSHDEVPAAMPHPNAPSGQQAPETEETGLTPNGSTAVAVEPAALGKDFQQQLAASQAELESSSTSESPMHPVASPENTIMPPPISNGNVPNQPAPANSEAKRESPAPVSEAATKESPQLSDEEPVSADAFMQKDSTFEPEAEPPPIINIKVSTQPAPAKSEVKRAAPAPVSAVATEVSRHLPEKPVSADASRQRDSTFEPQAEPPPIINIKVSTQPAPAKSEVKRAAPAPVSAVATEVSPHLSEKPVSTGASRQEGSTVEPQADEQQKQQLLPQHLPSQDAADVPCATGGMVEPDTVPHTDSRTSMGNGHLGDENPRSSEDLVHYEGSSPSPQTPSTRATQVVDGFEQATVQQATDVGNGIETAAGTTTVIMADEHSVRVESDRLLTRNISLKEAQEAKAAIAKASTSRARAEAYFNRHKDSSMPSKPPTTHLSDEEKPASAASAPREHSGTTSSPYTSALVENQEPPTPGGTRKQEPQALERVHEEQSGTPASAAAGAQVPKGPPVLSDANETAVGTLWKEDLSPAAQALANQEWAEDTEVPSPRHTAYEETSSPRLKSISGWQDAAGTHPSPKTPVPPTPGQGPRARREFVPSRGASRGASRGSQRSTSLQSPRSPAGSSMESSSVAAPRAEVTLTGVAPLHEAGQDNGMLGNFLAPSDAYNQSLSECEQTAVTQQPSRQQQQQQLQQHQEPQQQQQQPAEVSGQDSRECLGTQQAPGIEMPPPGINASESYLEETTPHKHHATLSPMKERPLPPSPPKLSPQLDTLNSQTRERPPSSRLPKLPVQSPACDATSQQTPGLSDHQLEPSLRTQSWSVGRENSPRGSSTSQPPHAPVPGEHLVAEQVSSPAGKRPDRKHQQQTQQRAPHLESWDSSIRPSTSSSSTYYGHSMQEADALLGAEMRRRALLHGMIQLSGAYSSLFCPSSDPASAL